MFLGCCIRTWQQTIILYYQGLVLFCSILNNRYIFDCIFKKHPVMPLLSCACFYIISKNRGSYLLTQTCLRHKCTRQMAFLFASFCSLCVFTVYISKWLLKTKKFLTCAFPFIIHAFFIYLRNQLQSHVYSMQCLQMILNSGSIPNDSQAENYPEKKLRGML